MRSTEVPEPEDPQRRGCRRVWRQEMAHAGRISRGDLFLPGPMGDGAEQISVCLTVLLHFPLPRVQGQNLDSRTSVQSPLSCNGSIIETPQDLCPRILKLKPNPL